MRKVIAAINTTIDGICDHNVGLPSEEIHQHYTELLNQADVILYGSTTYQLMQYWQTLLKNPSGKKTADDFAIAIDRIQKIVFSHKLKNPNWASATMANQPIGELVKELKQQSGKDILVGSRSLIIQLLNLNLVDELQLCLHPMIASKGLPLFEHMNNQSLFKLNSTKVFANGAITLYYGPI